MAKSRSDSYSNVAFGICTCSAANTLTFAQIMFGVGLFEGKAMLVHRLNYWPTLATVRELAAATDQLEMALTTSNRLTALTDLSDPAIISSRRVVGMGATVEPIHLPIQMDYSQMPGGGKLIPANPLYLGVTTAGYAAAAVVRVQLEFTFVELSPADYLELIQSIYPANIS